jgi:signal transduction histidine kinase
VAAFAATPSIWLTDTAIFLGLTAVTLASMTFLIRRLESSVETSRALVFSLEQRVRERELVQEALRASEARLLEAQRVARIGSFEWYGRGQTLWLSDEMYRVLGRERGAESPGMESLLDQIHPEDREGVDAAVDAWDAEQEPSALTRQLLAFSRRQFLQPRVLDLNEVVRELEGMLGRLIGADVECELSLDPSLGRVMADAGQIQRIVLNLSLNARDAMPHGGRLTIQTGEVDSLPDRAGAAVGSDPVRYVRLSVSDDGCGMDPETRARIFEPFFTTKDAGRGTGLGLSTVYGIVKQSDGEIRVRSAPGRGTTVEVYLPRIDQWEEPAAASSDEAGAGHPGVETILVVEDEEPVRRMTCSALERSGYQILEAGDGAEALAIARGHRDSRDLILTDLVMPEMGGVALVERLREERPGIRVLFMSGYAHHPDWEAAALPADAALLEKPFGPRELTRKVRQTLDG